MNAIIRKELLDLAKWIPICMLAIGGLCWIAVPNFIGAQDIEQTLVATAGGGCALAALLFGFLQSLPDSRNDASGFLLHRPISTSKIFWAKLIAGAIAYVISVAVPLSVTATYLELVGPEKMPTSGWQVLRVAVFSILIFAFHPTAMWIAWGRYWSRLLLFGLPFGLPILGIASATGYLEIHLLWFALAILFTPLLAAWGARHAFCHTQFSPSANDDNANHWIETLAIAIVCVFVVSVGGTIAGEKLARTGMMGSAAQRGWLPKVAVSDNGEIWELREQWDGTSAYSVEYTGRKLENAEGENSQFAALPDDFEESLAVAFTGYELMSRPWKPQFEYEGMLDGAYAYQHVGNVYVYNHQLLGKHQLIAVATPQGFFSPDEVPQGRFDNLRSVSFASGTRVLFDNGTRNLSISGASLRFDATGVYQISGQTRTVTKLVDEPVEQVSVMLPTKNREAALWTLNGTKVKKYSLNPKSNDDSFAQLPIESSSKNFAARTYEIPISTATLEQDWDIEPFSPNRKYETLSIYDAADTVVMTRQNALTGNDGTVDYKILDAEGTLDKSGSFELDSFAVTSLPSVSPDMFAPIPPIMLGYLALPNTGSPGTVLLVGLAVQGLLAAALTFWLASWLGLPARSRVAWAVSSGLLGFGITLALWCIRVRSVKEPCPKCESPRSVDLMQCEKCGAAWDRPAPDGTEIIGPKLAGVEVGA